MKWFETGLKSKVGRRILAVFCISSLLPLFAFAMVSYLEVDRQIQQQTRERLHRTTKSMAQSFVGQLQLLADDLRGVASELRQANPSGELFSAHRVRQRFVALGIQREGGIQTPLLGDLPPVVELPDDATDHLAKGSCVLACTEEVEPRILMAVALDPNQPDRGLLIGEPGPTTIFGGEEAQIDAPGTSIFIFDPHRRLLHGSSHVSPAEIARLAAALPRGSSGVFQWKGDASEYLAYSWSIPLSFEFHSAPWTVVRSESAAWVFAPLESFRKNFLLLAAITLLVAVALSLGQIRQSLTPLAKLTEGTRRVASGDFSASVKLSSGDEFEDLARSFNIMSGEIQELHVSTLTALAHAVDAKSSWTAGHTERVCRIALEVARQMGLSESELVTLQRGALLHDIGKIGVPTHLLDKPGPLTEDEMAQVRAHPEIGARILEPIRPFSEVIPLVRSHHERYDGQGYPDGLRGQNIRLDVRILTVADAFDAMVSDRPYRQGMCLELAGSILRREAGRQFDPNVVGVLLGLLRQPPFNTDDLQSRRACEAQAAGLVHLAAPVQDFAQREVR